MWLTTLKKMQDVPDGQQHQLLYSFFREQDATKRPFCYRDTGDEILMLSSVQPSTESKEIKLSAGQTLMFECRASLNSRRYKDRVIKPAEFTAKHIKEWFKRRLEDAAYVDYVTFKRLQPHKIIKNDGHLMILDQTIFYGTLTIINPAQLEKIASHGIGKGGAFGFGMLILPQVMS